MGSVNHVEIEGRVASFPEIRYSVRGRAILDFRLALRHGSLRRGVEDLGRGPSPTALRATEAESAGLNLVHVTVAGATAEACAEHMRRGQHVWITGRFAQEHWALPEHTCSRAKIVARSVLFPEISANALVLEDKQFIRDSLRPVLQRFKKRLNQMTASEASAFLSETVEPFVDVYNSHRSRSAEGAPSLWPAAKSP